MNATGLAVGGLFVLVAVGLVYALNRPSETASVPTMPSTADQGSVERTSWVNLLTAGVTAANSAITIFGGRGRSQSQDKQAVYSGGAK